MSVYTTSTQVAYYLPPSSIGTGTGQITSASVTDAISKASGEVDDGLPNYWRFPEIGSTPDTPVLIQECATKIAAAICLERLGAVNYADPGDASSVDLRARAWELLRKLRDGEAQIDRVRIEDETITWGDDDPIESHYHAFLFGGANEGQPWEVIPPSVMIWGYE